MLYSCPICIANYSVTFGMSDFESLNVKLSETDMLFLLILNVLDWNITGMLDGASLLRYSRVLYYVYLINGKKTIFGWL